MRALRDPRPLAILAPTIALSALLAFTPLPGRAWLVLGWGVLMYLAAAAVVARSRSRRDAPAPENPPPPVPPPAPAPAPPVARYDEADWFGLTEEALRKLNNPAALGKCALADRLPLTLDRRNGHDGARLRHQQLRAILLEAIDRLKPADVLESDAQSLHHAILREEYVLGHPAAQIAMRHAIAERGVFRHRRDAISALAEDLAAQEAALSRPSS